MSAAPVEPRVADPIPPAQAASGAAGGLNFGPAADRLADEYDVLTACQVFLARNPESSAAIQQKLNRPVRAIAQEFMRSAEFGGLIAEPGPRGAAKLVHARSRVPLASEQVAWLGELLDLPPERVAELKSEAAHRSLVLIELEAPAARAAIAPGGPLAGHGWVIARSAIERIGIHLGEYRVCAASLEPAPAELAKRYPHYANAKRIGFRFSATLRGPKRPAGDAIIAVVVRTADGATTHKLVPVTIAAEAGAASAEPAAGAARGQESAANGQTTQQQGADASAPARQPAVGTARRLAKLQRLGHPPFFFVLVRVQSLGAEDVRAIQATLRSLQSQAYPNWRGIVALPPGCPEGGATALLAAHEPRLLGHVRVRAAERAGLPPWPELNEPRFLVVVPAGERLAPEALLQLATTTAADLEADLVLAGEQTGGARRPRRLGLPSAGEGGQFYCVAGTLLERAAITADKLALPHGDVAVARLLDRARRVARLPDGLCLPPEPKPFAGEGRPGKRRGRN